MSFVDTASHRNNDYFTRLEVDDEDGNEFTDRWNTSELLCLASAVQRSGDKNWKFYPDRYSMVLNLTDIEVIDVKTKGSNRRVSVSRSIKLFGEPKRPSDWYTPKVFSSRVMPSHLTANCALQYSKLLKGVEDFKKKSLPRTERETSEELLVKNLTDKRITELQWLNPQTKNVANSLKYQIELLESGEYDDNLDELLKQVEEQEKRDEDDFKEWIAKRESLNAAKRLNKCRVPLTKGKAPSRGLDSKRKNSPNPDQLEDASSIHSTVPDIVIKTEVDTDHEFSISAKPVHIKTETIEAPSSIAALLEGSKASNVVSPLPSATAPTSPLLTSLLRNVPSSNTVPPVVSYVNSPLKEVKVESSTQSSNSMSDSPRKTEVFISPTKTVMTGISPLLTSLLKSPTSAAPTSTSMASHSKEAESSVLDNKISELDLAALIAKSVESSPRSSIPVSPRPTPASSPLLNSLLKNSPSAASPLTSIQLSQTKEWLVAYWLCLEALCRGEEKKSQLIFGRELREILNEEDMLRAYSSSHHSGCNRPSMAATTPKAVSSPQSFFNPTSALATAAAQQLAVATSSLPQNHVFFSTQDIESRKIPLSSPVTSACLSAPTLSKLLEMPPSTPGRLPPLPVVDTVPIHAPTTPVSTPEPVIMQSPQKLTATMLLNELELQMRGVSPKKPVESSVVTQTPLDQSSQKQIPVPVSSVEERPLIAPITANVKTAIGEQPKIPFKHLGEVDDTSQENIDILEAVCESINQAFEKKENKQDPVDAHNNLHTQGKSPKEISLDNSNTLNLEKVDGTLTDDLLSCINIDKLVSSDIGLDKVFSAEDLADISDLNLFEDEKQKSDVEMENLSEEQIPEASIDASEEVKVTDEMYFKNKLTPTKKRPSTEDEKEKTQETSPSKVSPKKPNKCAKVEAEPDLQVAVNEQILLAVKEAEEATLLKIPDKTSPPKSNEMKSPVAKKPRLFEKLPPTKDKNELSEDEISTPKRPGRKAKKGRRPNKSTPAKPDEPKDQYEFSESTEENSVGYQATNSLCYMPRQKEDSRLEEPKPKQPSSPPEETVPPPNTLVPTPEKKLTPSIKNKPGRPPLQTARKSLFTSEDEKVSESVIIEDVPSSQAVEDTKWKEFSEKKEDNIKDIDIVNKASQKPAKMAESTKKKHLQLTKKNLFAGKTDTSKKERKSVSSDVEESSVCSRDSEDIASSTTWQKEESETNEEKVPSVVADVESEANDSRMSSTMTVGSDKQMDESESYESLQGSVVTEFSPLPQTEVKEEKDTTHFGKQDWFHGGSPKSVDPVSQSSEDSEYDSDNWDNQSVSTNKSASHSASQSSRTKRKERESPQYKAWKKAINIVLREASCHKFANVFLQKVTNDVAPGYLNIVNRPMDLSLIKKNVDNGVIKTTAEVHRDMLLMFQNAVMYNSSDHDVHHMAVEMQRDVIQQIQNFLLTQYNDKDEGNDPTSSLRGARSAKSQKVYASNLKPKEENHEKE